MLRSREITLFVLRAQLCQLLRLKVPAQALMPSSDVRPQPQPQPKQDAGGTPAWLCVISDALPGRRLD